MARLMPTPPMGDMAWAASPMQRSPGRDHWVRRSTATVSRLMSFQSRSSSTRSRRNGTRLANFVGGALGDHEGTLPIGFAIEQDHQPSAIDVAEGLARV